MVINSATKEISFYRLLLLILLLIFISHFGVDLILSLKYTFLIESKVGALLLQFVIVQSKDVTDILSTIHNFEISILNIDKNYTSNKIPIETV